jgi:alkaline phosphatase
VLVEQPGGEFFGSRPLVTQEQAIDPDYLQQALIPMTSETHSGEDVMVFAQGPWAHLFGGTIEQNVIFHVMNHAVTAQ